MKKIQLNNETFFKFFACHAFGKESKKLLNEKDRIRARVQAVCLGVFTLGIGTLVCHLCLKDRKIITGLNLVRLQKTYLLSRFSGSDLKKIDLMNSLYTDSHSFISKFKLSYEILKSNEAGTVYFCMRKKAFIHPHVIAAVCLFEVMDLLNSNQSRKYEKIQELERGLLDQYNIDFYRKALVNQCEVNPLIRKIAHSSNQDKDAYLKLLYKSDFNEFKAIYEDIKAVFSAENVPNHFLIQQPDSSLDRKIRILAYTCELIACLSGKGEDKSKQLFSIIDQRVENMDPLNGVEKMFLETTLLPYWSLKSITSFISFLIVTKGSPLNSDKFDRVEMVNEIINSFKVINFVKPKELSHDEKWLQSAVDHVFINYDGINYKKNDIQNLINNLTKLRKLVTVSYDDSFKINLKEMSKANKDKLFSFLSLKNVDLKKIKLSKPFFFGNQLIISKVEGLF